jgi:hypothetical protein
MSDSYLDRFVRAVEEGDRGVFVGPDAEGRRLLAEYLDDHYDPPLVLDFTEAEFEEAVHATGRGARSLWPEVPEPEAGIRLMLVHLYESMRKEKRPTRRIYVSRGQLWAE